MFKLDKTNDYSSEIYVGNFKEAVDIKERAGRDRGRGCDGRSGICVCLYKGIS